jgi:hypothetical protein
VVATIREVVVSARPATAPDEAEVLVAVASRLWPPPAVVSLARGRARGSGARDHLVLPSRRRPMLVLPAAPRRAAAAVARHASSDAGPAHRLARSAAGLAARVGLAGVAARDRLRIAGGDDDVERALAEVLGEPVVVAVDLGTARANRKPILHVLDRAGRSLAFVKVGDTPETAALVDREAAALRVVHGAGLRLVRPPALLHHGTWQGLRLLVLGPLLGRAPRRRELPLAAMAELARGAGALRTDPLVRSTFWARLEAAVAALGTPASRDRLAAAMGRLAASRGEHAVDLGWGHGDWAPWNMAWRDGRVDLWDWERFEQDQPVGSDAVHHVLHGTARRGGDWDRALAAAGAAAGDAVRALGSTAPGGGVVDLYLLDLAVRYAGAAEGTRGAAIATRTAWALDAVDRRW